jgi:hypothetical protein
VWTGIGPTPGISLRWLWGGHVEVDVRGSGRMRFACDLPLRLCRAATLALSTSKPVLVF